MTSSDSTPADTSSNDQFLLVTGCYRSGTTLSEKLLHGHPNVCVASQPFPILYFYLKEAFLKSKGLERRYPLDHRFLEDGYTQAEFDGFLASYKLTRTDINTVFDRLADYKLGLWTPAVLDLRDRVGEGTFWDLFRQITRRLSEILEKPEAVVRGTKEIFCEEYIPHFVSRGGKVVVVIRDPRDMISSLDFRERDNWTGDHRPILYSLRAWRKSVAYALAYEDHPSVVWLRYEDLVADLASQLERLTETLGVDSFEPGAFDQGIIGQDGKHWTGNSSFTDQSGVSTASHGGFRERMPENVVAYVETVCGPEMATLGYEPEVGPDLDEAAMLAFKEPFESTHVKFPRDYSRTAQRVGDEVRRLSLLEPESGELTEDEAARWFIDHRAYARLRQTVDFRSGARI